MLIQKQLIDCFESIDGVKGNDAAFKVVNEIWNPDPNERIKSIFYLKKKEQKIILEKARHKAVQDYKDMLIQTFATNLNIIP